ncbi:MAG: hypothetical protein HOO96_00465, partial [Polyangiaceae bacterium]|nr:hypothetical protein [Polyangiaceae bacterium]
RRRFPDRGYVVRLTPEVADGTCVSSRRRQPGPSGTAVDVTSAQPDNCGPASLVAILANCTNHPVRIGEVRIEVRGRTPDASGYALAETEVLPGNVARVPVRTRGVGDLTVTFALEHDRRRDLAEGHARVRLASTVIDE